MNISQNIYASVKITRPLNVCITFIAVIISGLVCGKHQGINRSIFLAALAASLITAAGNIINDIFDIQTDKLNHKINRPLATGELKVVQAIILYALFTIIAFVLAYYINTAAFIVTILTSIILYYYSYYFKTIPLTGNIVVAGLTSLAFVFGGIAVGNISGAVIPAAFAFVINLMREIIKDIQDIEGDKKSGFATFPIKYGIKQSCNLVIFLAVITIVFPFMLWSYGFYHTPFYIIIIFLVNPLFVFIIRYLFINALDKNLVKISIILKLNMVLGLLAIYLGV